MMITKDKFLTEIIGKSVYNIKGGLIYPDNIKQHNRLLCIKIRADRIEDFNFFVGLGFQLVGTEVTFITDKTVQYYRPPQYHIVEVYDIVDLDRHTKEAVKRVALEAFVYDRFHRDPSIDNNIANKIKSEWAGNALNGKRGDCTAVAFDPIGNPMGFLIVLEKEDKAIIDLIAVNPNAQKKGVGSDLMRWFLRKYADLSISSDFILQVGTQIDNEASIKLYKKFGIDTIIGFNYVLHLHT